MPCSTPMNATMVVVADREGELEVVEAQNLAELCGSEQAGGDEDKYGAERRLGYVAEDVCGEDGDRQDAGRRHNAGELGSASGVGDELGAGRAGVDGERAAQPGQEVSGSQRHQVPVEVLGGTRVGLG